MSVGVCVCWGGDVCVVGGDGCVDFPLDWYVFPKCTIEDFFTCRVGFCR